MEWLAEISDPPDAPRETAVPAPCDLPEHLRFASTVAGNMRPLVEALFFFNPCPRRIAQSIRRTIKRTGSPAIVDQDDRIWLTVPSGRMQCLFASDGDGRPLAVALFSRPVPHLLRICHLAVQPDGALSIGRRVRLARRVVAQILRIARSIKGITCIQLPYRRARFLRVRREHCPH